MVRYMSRKQAADYLTARGIDTKPNTLAVWACNGRYQLRFLKLGNQCRYDVADLDALIESHLVTPGLDDSGCVA